MSGGQEMERHDVAPEPDLSFCELEPIHAPGAIQPHGALVVALVDGLVVTHVSANLSAIVGLPAAGVLGRPLQAVCGEARSQALVAALLRGDGSDGGAVHTMAGPNGQPLHLHTFRSGGHICIDIQPIHPEAAPASPDTLMRSAMSAFAHATRPVELCALAVQGLKAVTGYDRVMAYRYAADGHGEVIAEACEPHMEPYLGLHYPAADVPPQSRRLFLRQRVCVIADTSYTPVPLLSKPALEDGVPLDLTLSTLRSVSPIHREYLRNMNVAASLSVALVRANQRDEPTLWGMFVCHGEAPRVAGPDLQSVLGMIGQVVSMLVGGLEEAELYAQMLARNSTLRVLVERIAVPVPLHTGLAAGGAELLKLTGATGALVHISGTVLTVGRTPPAVAAERALALLRADSGDDVLAVDDLGIRYPELADCIAEGSGALLMTLPQASGSAILWFRPERVRTVTWGGNPDLHASTDPVSHRLSPRGSFAAWKQIERGRSLPWGPADLAIACELRRSVAVAVADRTSAALARLRHYDPLTGLPNRSLLEERLADQERGKGTGAALMFLDLDGFKAVNDTMGHAAGDTLLIAVAERLVMVAGPDNLAARLGGDEFVVLCPGLDQHAMAALGERIRQAIEAPIEISGRPCRVTSSIGIAVAGQTGGLDLVRAADMAMYAAKQAGGNRALLFEPSLYDRASLRFELEEDMRTALSRGDEFVLLYQPIFSVTSRTRRLAGFEALARWKHPRHGWMSPALFIPLAEKSGLILPLGDWVLATALQHGRLLRQEHPDANLTMNVNVSVLQIPESGYCLGVADALAAEGYPAAALCLEVVESMLADAAAGAVLSEVRKLGVQVAIDDFGIGFSSLSYLRRLPVDKVKLDRSFLEDIEGDARGEDFVRAVIALAHAAGKPVVFEGIETQAQFDIARGAGTDLVQGFFFAPPLSANAAMELVTQQRQLDEHRATEVPRST
jgi:diguanylate cyclase (GGDEF)-like protein